MGTIQQLKIGSMNLKFTKPRTRRKNYKDFIGVLKSDTPAVNTVRKLRDMDSKRDKKRLNEK